MTTRVFTLNVAEVGNLANELLEQSFRTETYSTKFDTSLDGVLALMRADESAYFKARNARVRRKGTLHASTGSFADSVALFGTSLALNLRLTAEATAAAAKTTLDYDTAKGEAYKGGNGSIPDTAPIVRPQGSPSTGEVLTGTSPSLFRVGPTVLSYTPAFFAPVAASKVVGYATRGGLGAAELVVKGAVGGTLATVRGVLGAAEFTIDNAVAGVGSVTRVAAAVPFAMIDGAAAATTAGVRTGVSAVTNVGAGAVSGLAGLYRGVFGTAYRVIGADGAANAIDAGTNAVSRAASGVANSINNAVDTTTNWSYKAVDTVTDAPTWSVDKVTDAAHWAVDRTTDGITWTGDVATDATYWTAKQPLSAITWVADKATDGVHHVVSIPHRVIKP